MTLDEFYNLHKEKFLDFDGIYEFQCVDLTKAYDREVIGGTGLKGNAIDYIKNPSPQFYEYFSNTLLYIPPKGAIAVWNSKVGAGFGHVGIVLEASLMKFKSFDQNWPKGSPPLLVDHTYTNVVGFLVPKTYIIKSKDYEIVSDLKWLVSKHKDSFIL